MKTKTQKSQERRTRQLIKLMDEAERGHIRNAGVGQTIQDLKRAHKLAGGTHFHALSTTHGHPIDGRFVESEGRGVGKRFYVRTLTHDRKGTKDADVATIAGPFLTHAGAMNAAKNAAKN